LTLKIDFENQILALFDGYFWPFNKSHEKIKSIFVISAIIPSIWNVFIELHRHGMTIVLCYVLLCCLIFWAKYWAIYKIYEQNLMIRYALCYAVLCCLMISLWKVSKILCPVMLCLWWHELKSKILWYVMLVLFVSKILCSVMNLTIYYYVLFSQFLLRPARKESNVYTVHPNKIVPRWGPPSIDHKVKW